MGIRIECPYCGNKKANGICARSSSLFNGGLVDYEVICGSCNKHFGLRTVRYAHPLPTSEPKNTEKEIDVFTRGDDEITEAIYNFADNIRKVVGADD